MVNNNSTINFVITSNNQVFNFDDKILISLYSPIIGSKAYFIYNHLVNEYNLSKKNSTYNSHKFAGLMGLSSSEFLAAKERLEAMNLLKTFYRKTQDIYNLKIQTPLNPETFFYNSKFLSALELKVDSQYIKDMKKIFLDEKTNTKNEEDVSKVFEDIFNDFNSSVIDFSKIDYKLMNKKINPNIYFLFRNKIIKIARIYHLDTTAVCKLMLESVAKDEHNLDYFNFDLFQSKAHSLYDIQLLKKSSNVQLEMAINKNVHTKKYEFMSTPQTLQEVKIQEMSLLDPFEYYSLLFGKKPSTKEAELIKDLIVRYNLQSDVINCVLDFIALKNSRVLNFNYALKIANTISQLNINNAVDAMDYFKKAFKKSNLNRNAKYAFSQLKTPKSPEIKTTIFDNYKEEKSTISIEEAKKILEEL